MLNVLMIEFRGTPLVIWIILILCSCVGIGFVFYIDKLEGVPYGTNFKKFYNGVIGVAKQTLKGFKQIGLWFYEFLYNHICNHRTKVQFA